MNNTKMVEFGEVTMSSLEIAELTGKEHRNVTVDIEKMLLELGQTTADFSAVYKADNNQEYRCFNLPKRETLILVSGYNIELRARIIDRWQELENQITQPKLSENYIKDLVELEVKKQLAKKPVSRKKKKTEAIDFPDAVIAANEALASKGDGRPLFDFITRLSCVFPRELVRASIKDMGLIVGNWGLPSEYSILKGWMYFTTKDIWLGLGKGSIEHTSVFITPKGQNQIMDILRK